MRIRTGFLGGVAMTGLVAVAGLGGCNKNKKADTTTKDEGDTSSSVAKVDPTLCETSGKNVLTYDLNRDGRPDVWKMYKVEDQGGTKVEILTCKQVDFDHDGRKDWVVGYTPRGSSSTLMIRRPSGQTLLDPDVTPQPGDELVALPHLDPKYQQLAADFLSLIFQVAVAARIFQ